MLTHRHSALFENLFFVWTDLKTLISGRFIPPKGVAISHWGVAQKEAVPFRPPPPHPVMENQYLIYEQFNRQ